MYQIAEAAQLRRYLPAQLVLAEVQPFQVGEAAQLQRYLPPQLVPPEVQILASLARLPNSGGISPLNWFPSR